MLSRCGVARCSAIEKSRLIGVLYPAECPASLNSRHWRRGWQASNSSARRNRNDAEESGSDRLESVGPLVGSGGISGEVTVEPFGKSPLMRWKMMPFCGSIRSSNQRSACVG